MNKITRNVLLLLIVVSFFSGCSTAPQSGAKRDSLHADVMATITRFKAEDPSMSSFFDEAHGYAVFPTVGKGGIGIGGAYGKGELFEQGEKVGYYDLSQATIGFQLGGRPTARLSSSKPQAHSASSGRATSPSPPRRWLAGPDPMRM